MRPCCRRPSRSCSTLPTESDLASFPPGATVNQTIKIQRDLIVDLQDRVRVWGEVCRSLACPRALLRLPTLTTPAAPSPLRSDPAASAQERPRHQRDARRDLLGPCPERPGHQQPPDELLVRRGLGAVRVAVEAVVPQRADGRPGDALAARTVLSASLRTRRVVPVQPAGRLFAAADAQHAQAHPRHPEVRPQRRQAAAAAARVASAVQLCRSRRPPHHHRARHGRAQGSVVLPTPLRQRPQETDDVLAACSPSSHVQARAESQRL